MCRREDSVDRNAHAATLLARHLAENIHRNICRIACVSHCSAVQSAMVRSTCKVVVRLKPKDDPLDTAVQCIDNTAVCVFSVMYRAAITSAIAFTSPLCLAGAHTAC